MRDPRVLRVGPVAGPQSFQANPLVVPLNQSVSGGLRTPQLVWTWAYLRWRDTPMISQNRFVKTFSSVQNLPRI